MSKLIELIIIALPYPFQMRDIDIGADYVRFTWRGARYHVTERGVEEVGDGVLIGSDRAILMRALIDSARVKNLATESRRST